MATGDSNNLNAAQRRDAFTDVQLALSEVEALMGCIYLAIVAGPDNKPNPDILAACDGILRMIGKISNDLCDLEPSATPRRAVRTQEVAHG